MQIELERYENGVNHGHMDDNHGHFPPTHLTTLYDAYFFHLYIPFNFAVVVVVVAAAVYQHSYIVSSL